MGRALVVHRTLRAVPEVHRQVLTVYCDGSITGSHWAKKGQKHTLPHAWAGWVAYDSDGNHVHHHSLDVGENESYSANVAEYFAVRSALHWVSKNVPHAGVHVKSDSQLVMRQLSGLYHCHDDKLRVLLVECRRLAALLPFVKYEWIRREQNVEADYMSKALQIWGRVPTWEEVQLRIREDCGVED